MYELQCCERAAALDELFVAKLEFVVRVCGLGLELGLGFKSADGGGEAREEEAAGWRTTDSHALFPRKNARGRRYVCASSSSLHS